MDITFRSVHRRFQRNLAEYNCAIWFAGANSILRTHYIQIRPQDNHVILHCRCTDDQKDILANTVTLCLQKSVSSTLHQRFLLQSQKICQVLFWWCIRCLKPILVRCVLQIQEINYTFRDTIKKEPKADIFYPIKNLPQVVSAYVSRRLHRHWDRTPLLKKVLQVLWHVAPTSINCLLLVSFKRIIRCMVVQAGL